MKFTLFKKKKALENNLSRSCEATSCGKPGAYRAPKKDGTSDPQHAETWHWFCLNHVKIYNQSWNYFSQMTEAEVIDTWRKDMTWERPSWPLGGWHGKQWKTYQSRPTDQGFSDPFGLFDQAINQPSPFKSPLTAEENLATKTLDLSFPFTLKQLQTTYRDKVKKFHPDVNQGCLKAEETFKKINHAYSLLKNHTID